MGMGKNFEARQDIGGQSAGRLRPAETRSARASQHAAGPFEISAERKAPGLRDAMVTGLLVIYPALATVAAIVAGLFLTGASA